MQEACSLLGIPYTPTTPAAPSIAAPVTNEALRIMARETLAELIMNMRTEPEQFKPSEIISACKEALDRTEGKAAQSLVIDSKQTITHEHYVKMDPAKAYAMLASGEVEVIDMEPIMEKGGRDTVNTAAGGDKGEGASDNSHQIQEILYGN